MATEKQVNLALKLQKENPEARQYDQYILGAMAHKEISEHIQSMMSGGGNTEVPDELLNEMFDYPDRK